MKFIARQPILDRRSAASTPMNCSSALGSKTPAMGLTSVSGVRVSIFDTSFLIGFIEADRRDSAPSSNCPREFPAGGLHIPLFPRDQVVIELLETLAPDQEVVDTCRRLKQDGLPCSP